MTLDGTVLEESADLVILGVLFDAKSAQLSTHALNYWTELSGVLVFYLVVF